MTELHVLDLDRMASWYAEILGLRVVVNDRQKGFVLLEAPGGRGRLALKRSAEAAKGCRLVFQVMDPDVERSRLAAAGVAVGDPTENAEEHYREVRLVDPEGTPITLFAWTPRREDRLQGD